MPGEGEGMRCEGKEMRFSREGEEKAVKVRGRGMTGREKRVCEGKGWEGKGKRTL